MYIVSLFSGAGGLDLGFEQEGFEPAIAFDISPAAVATYNYNRGATIAHLADLAVLVGDDIIDAVDNLRLTGSLRGVVGGPPCQYFSNGNKATRDIDDPRRILPLKYAEILAQLNGRYKLDFFAFENVPGIMHQNHQTDFARIRQMFEYAGFHVCSRVLDAVDFGVAQYRKRVILVGWNRELYPDALEKYRFPEGAPSRGNIESQICDLAEPKYWARNLEPESFPEHPNHWTMNPNSSKFGNPLPSDIGPGTRSFRRLSWGKPSYTVAYGHNEIHVHPNGHRRLSIYEAMLLQGFPRGRYGYRLLGGLSEQVRLISDAVPPPLARALAESIRDFIEEHATPE
ncbi:MAG: DNA cytosine methyltransferase [Anaerolineae bacterium]|nr:DNA cytosine methyltransferase [Anaerolineae bacterium]